MVDLFISRAKKYRIALSGLICLWMLFSSSITHAQEQVFVEAFQEYLDSRVSNLEACQDQACFDNLDFPVIIRDSTNQLVYWNQPAMFVQLPTNLPEVLIDQEQYYFVYTDERLRTGFIPVKYEASAQQSKFLRDHIGGGFEFANYEINQSKGSGKPRADQIISHVIIKKALGRTHVIIYFLSVIFLFLVVLNFSTALLKIYGDWLGATLVILLLTCVRLLFSLPTLTAPLVHHDIFQHQLNSSILSPSLGELFLNMMLFFVITIFLFKSFDSRPIRKHDSLSRWYFLVSGYLLVMGSIISFVYVVKRVVIHSSISFQFDKIYILDWNTHIFILSILLFISSLFFLSYLLIKILGSTGANLGQRLIAFFIATIITFPVFLNFTLHVSAFGFYILVLSILILMDLFVETRQKSISWLVIWLVTITSGTTALLYSHNSIAYYQKGTNLAHEIVRIQTSSDETWEDLNNVNNFHWALYDGYNLVRKSGNPPLDFLREENIPPIGELTHNSSKNQRSMLYRQSPGTTVVISKPQNVVIQFISLYSFLFTSLTLVIFLIFLLNLFLRFLPDTWNLKIGTGQSIRRRIQYVIFSMLILSFATVFAVTSFYLRDYRQDASKLSKSQQLGVQIFSEFIKNTDLSSFSPDDGLDNPIGTSQFNLFTYSGERIGSNKNNVCIRPPFQLTKLSTGITKKEFTFSTDNTLNAFKQVIIDQTTYIIGVADNITSQEQDYFINNLLGTLLNLYIFLFVIASSIALTFSDTITRPLLKLREKFSSVKIGRSNERIDWHSNDELGQLITDYNRMLEKIEESVTTLAMTERELAWREMAKQVAHEIKNPLTPMKLSLQHLQLAIKREPERAEELVDRLGKTLLEQIDNLSRIAAEFSNFGKMPKPENKKVVLNDVASSVHDLFRKREDMDINLYIPIDEIYVFGDRHYMTRVLINLLKNAIQAIPNERRGNIQIHVYKDDENAIIKVTDNGSGIPQDIRHKVFQPNFTSKNSGTGLGLAICANIVESFNGKIYFETEENIGTTFFIEIPLMHMADNFKKEKHVIL